MTKIVHAKFYIILMTNIKSTLSVCELLHKGDLVKYHLTPNSISLAFLIFVVTTVLFLTKILSSNNVAKQDAILL